MLLHDLVQTSRRVAKTSGRLAKIGLLADLLARATSDEIETAIAFLSGTTTVERLGVGWAALQSARGHAAAKAPSMAATMFTGMILMALCFWMYSIAVALTRVRAEIAEAA